MKLTLRMNNNKLNKKKLKLIEKKREIKKILILK
jgi:hypothetical protein